jgi:hypothetical protein
MYTLLENFNSKTVMTSYCHSFVVATVANNTKDIQNQDFKKIIGIVVGTIH